MRKNRVNSSCPQPLVYRIFLAVIEIGVIILLCGLILFYALKVAQNLGYFKISDVLIRGNEQAELSYLKGKNIFSIDIARESEYLTQVYPDYRKIRLVRVLPNRLFIDFLRRIPVARVRFYRYFCVDQSGVLFELPQGADYAMLPVISGLETKIFGPKPGKKYHIRELDVALEIIKEVKKSASLKKYQLRSIDVADLLNISFLLAETPAGQPPKLANGMISSGAEFEVKIAQRNISEEVTFLGTILGQEKNRTKDLKYIDLRFKDAVIKYK